ncbi:glycosyltransferase, group 1 family protein [Ancylostoma ceylanicum]|uniref:Alpha-1,3/1,6-mannosyltransferase ALG2 n=1 Tax=Ancylostoma ceylanicum TaxID=53326 RepID=A0A0D6LG09_9BILA|nr:glycosyltransferase, group 1 family protein [Ancylostoma ceylanicum]
MWLFEAQLMRGTKEETELFRKYNSDKQWDCSGDECREEDSIDSYLYFLDSIEEFSTGLADVICVNSMFTASVFKQTFKSLKDRELTVLYPSLNTEFFDKTEECSIPEIPESAEYIFTSLNRFEVKKNIKLAIEAFADEEKITLLRRSRAVLYTPHNEHFGIVPVESMYVGTPVIAVNSGGPKESIVHLETGLLAEQLPEAFAECMARLIRDEPLVKKLRQMGPKRVHDLFAFEAFSSRLDHIVKGEEF